MIPTPCSRPRPLSTPPLTCGSPQCGRPLAQSRPVGMVGVATERLLSRRERSPRHKPERGHGLAYARTPLGQFRIRLRRRSPMVGNALAQVLPLGIGASLSRRRRTRDRTARCQFRARACPSRPRVYRPLADGNVVCTSPAPTSTGWAQRYSERQVLQALSVPAPNDSLPCPSGIPAVAGPGSTPGKVVSSLPRHSGVPPAGAVPARPLPPYPFQDPATTLQPTEEISVVRFIVAQADWRPCAAGR